MLICYFYFIHFVLCWFFSWNVSCQRTDGGVQYLSQVKWYRFFLFLYFFSDWFMNQSKFKLNFYVKFILKCSKIDRYTSFQYFSYWIFCLFLVHTWWLSQVIPGSAHKNYSWQAWRILWVARNQTWVGHMQGSHSTWSSI